MKTMKIQILAILAAMAIIPLADAALVIDSFSCNGQTTSISVENGKSLNCNAIILNNDLQNAASANQVSLVPSGDWTEEDSYTVALGTSIGAGQSTTVDFQDIRPTTPGDDHRFLHIDIDGTAHTEEVESASINSIIVKLLTASSSASSVSTGQQFDVSATVSAGGSFSSMALSLSLSSCQLTSGEAASKSLGAMSDNSQSSISWSLTQGTSDCVITVTATGTSGSVVVTKTKSITVTNPSTGSSGSSSSSGGGGGGGGGGGAGGAEANNQTEQQQSTQAQPQGQVPGETPAAGMPSADVETGRVAAIDSSEQSGTFMLTAAAVAIVLIVSLAIKSRFKK